MIDKEEVLQYMMLEKKLKEKIKKKLKGKISKIPAINKRLYVENIKVISGKLLIKFVNEIDIDFFSIEIGQKSVKLPTRLQDSVYIVDIESSIYRYQSHGEFKIYVISKNQKFEIIYSSEKYDSPLYKKVWNLEVPNSKLEYWIFISSKDVLMIQMDIQARKKFTNLPSIFFSEINIDSKNIIFSLENVEKYHDKEIEIYLTDEKNQKHYFINHIDKIDENRNLYISRLEILKLIKDMDIIFCENRRIRLSFLIDGHMMYIGKRNLKISEKRLVSESIPNINIISENQIIKFHIIFTTKDIQISSINTQKSVVKLGGIKNIIEINRVVFRGRDDFHIVEVNNYTFHENILKLNLSNIRWRAQYYDLYILSDDGFWHMLVNKDMAQKHMSDKMYPLIFDDIGYSYIYYSKTNKVAVTIDSLPKEVISAKNSISDYTLILDNDEIKNKNYIECLFAYNSRSNHGFMVNLEDFKSITKHLYPRQDLWNFYIKFKNHEYEKIEKVSYKKYSIKFSIIIINYNNGFNLTNLYNSLLNQNIDFLQTEVIFVDNNSTDNSKDIVEKTFSTLPNFSKRYLSYNSGPGEARNIGISLSQGEYLTFIDSDDTIPYGTYRKMLDIIRKEKSDIITATPQHKQGRKTWISGMYATTFAANRINISLNNCPELVYDLTVWNKLYKLSFLRDNNILFPEEVLYEDVQFVLKCYSQTEKITVCAGENVYWWQVNTHIGKKSITHRRNDIKNMSDRMIAIKGALQLLNPFPRARETYSQKIEDLDFHLYDNVLVDSTENYKDIYENHKREIRELITLEKKVGTER